MYQTSLALNRQSSYLQQAPLLNDGKRKQREQMNTTTGFDRSAQGLFPEHPVRNSTPSRQRAGSLVQWVRRTNH